MPEVIGSIPAGGEENSVSEHAFLRVIRRFLLLVFARLAKVKDPLQFTEHIS